jgi:hypothetical protein
MDGRGNKETIFDHWEVDGRNTVAEVLWERCSSEAAKAESGMSFA